MKFANKELLTQFGLLDLKLIKLMLEADHHGRNNRCEIIWTSFIRANDPDSGVHKHARAQTVLFII